MPHIQIGNVWLFIFSLHIKADTNFKAKEKRSMTKSEIQKLSNDELKIIAMQRSKKGVHNYTAAALAAQEILLEHINCCYMKNGEDKFRCIYDNEEEYEEEFYTNY